jgi:tetratricopeptide (TPR) repeat protein
MEPVSADDAESLYRLAWRREHEERDPARALEAYRAAAAIAPPPLAVDALFRAGFVAQAAGSRLQAIAAYRDCIAAADRLEQPVAAVVHAAFWLGFNLEADGRYLDAMNCYRQVAGGRGLLGLEAAYHGLLCLAAVGRLDEALAWSGGYADLAREARALGHDTRALVEAIERERTELTQVLRLEGAA